MNNHVGIDDLAGLCLVHQAAGTTTRLTLQLMVARDINYATNDLKLSQHPLALITAPYVLSARSRERRSALLVVIPTRSRILFAPIGGF